MQNIEQLSTSLNGRKRNLRNKSVVVKFTLSRSGGYRNEGMRSFDRDETNNFEGKKCLERTLLKHVCVCK